MEQVKFYLDKDTNEVFAYFLGKKNQHPNGMQTCYCHIGQHSECSPEYVKECKLATPEQYADLKKELESIGYKLKVSN